MLAGFFSALSFTTPLLLWGLIALPVLWWLLRAVPPAPLRAKFPGILLLLGLKDKETTPDRTPWWLLMLRILAVAALIIGFAGPVLNPADTTQTQEKLVIIMDADWASAEDWQKRRTKLTEILRQSDQSGRPVALLKLSDAPPVASAPNFTAAGAVLQDVETVSPNIWRPNYSSWSAYFSANEDTFDTVWFSDGLANPDREGLYAVLKTKGDVIIMERAGPVVALAPPALQDGQMTTTVQRSQTGTALELNIDALGPDPNGFDRVLGSTTVTLPASETKASVVFDIPVDLRNRVKSIHIQNRQSAGAVAMTGDSVQRRKVALIASAEQQESADLVSDVFYLRKALAPTADLIETDLKNTLLATPDVMIFVDVGKLSETETQSVLDWVEEGGLLVRFAGPRLAASQIGLREEHPLLPVRLRAGGRSVGGALSWGKPKRLEPFAEDTLFYGLTVPEDVSINSQVIAQPDPNLAERVVAALQDGTPLVTQKQIGNGRVVLFHTTANAEWSSLPLSGLFVQMLERLAISTAGNLEDAENLEGLTWIPEEVLDAFGVIREAEGLSGVEGAVLANRAFSKETPPGVYSNAGRQVAVNVIHQDDTLDPSNWPSGTTVRSLETITELVLKPYLLMAAISLMLLDIFAALWLSGKLRLRALNSAALFACAVITSAPDMGFAQSDETLERLVNNTVLGYVKTGNTKLDATSHAGLLGLSTELYRRTSVEPIEPVGIDIEIDDLSIFPFIYWPMSENQRAPSDAAVEKLNQFLRSGGMILFDTRDAYLSSGISGGTPNGRMLQKIANRLEIPPLEPIPEDHVLTRTFYLLQDFPGRYGGSQVWAEATPSDAEQIDGVPFRNLNDGVTPVIIGANDWAAAWAIDTNGRYMFPVGRGTAGRQQREYAHRFGINLIMYVLTGNYKSDQVHVPALLERLRQ